MSDGALWGCILAGCAACLALKVAGAYVPRAWLSGERVNRLMGLVTVALLAGLFAVQTAGQGRGLVLDARLAAVAVAGVALWLRAPFILVVVLAAVVAAALRALGWG